MIPPVVRLKSSGRSVGWFGHGLCWGWQLSWSWSGGWFGGNIMWYNLICTSPQWVIKHSFHQVSLKYYMAVVPIATPTWMKVGKGVRKEWKMCWSSKDLPPVTQATIYSVVFWWKSCFPLLLCMVEVYFPIGKYDVKTFMLIFQKFGK